MKLGTLVTTIWLIGFAAGVTSQHLTDVFMSFLSTIGWGIVMIVIVLLYIKSNE